MPSIFGIWLKISNIQLSSYLCQYIWKHTNRMPDTGPRCRIRMPDIGCRMYGNSPIACDGFPAQLGNGEGVLGDVSEEG